MKKKDVEGVLAERRMRGNLRKKERSGRREERGKTKGNKKGQVRKYLIR